MILIRFNADGTKHTVDLQNMFHGQAAMLVGGAPSLRKQPIHLLNSKGLLTMAINNAALHFDPVLWISGDNPACFAKEILYSPRIMKFAPYVHANEQAYGMPYRNCPNLFFYIQEANIPWDQYLASRTTTPWYNNTLFTSIAVLYSLGVRKIILAGSDFGKSDDGQMYAHETALDAVAHNWNVDLYNNLVRELRMLKPIFENADLELLDCSANSRLIGVYPHISMETAVEMCLTRFPKEPTDTKNLPHASKFAPANIVESIAQWPGHSVVDYDILTDDQKPKTEAVV